MTIRTTLHRLQVATPLARFIDEQVLPGTGITPATFWAGFDAIVHDLAPKNLALLAERDRLQAAIDEWHRAHPGPIADMPAYRAFLEQIGYLQPPPAGVKATTSNVDDELAVQAGPQLVVPILNARYALNAANARWGSLYDALYGTDAIPEDGGAERGGAYNPVRGGKVIAYARRVLDQAAPIVWEGKAASHAVAQGYRVENGRLVVRLGMGRDAMLRSSSVTRVTRPRPRQSCCATTACTWTSASIARRPSARSTPRALPTWSSRPPCRPSSTWRTRWRRWMPRTSCWPTATGSAS